MTIDLATLFHGSKPIEVNILFIKSICTRMITVAFFLYSCDKLRGKATKFEYSMRGKCLYKFCYASFVEHCVIIKKNELEIHLLA